MNLSEAQLAALVEQVTQDVVSEEIALRVKARKTIDAILIGVLPELAADTSPEGVKSFVMAGATLRPLLTAARLAATGEHEEARDYLRVAHQLEDLTGLPPFVQQHIDWARGT